MTIRDDVLEILALLEAEGVRVSIDAGGVVVEGATSAMSDRARAALATLEGRSAQLRRVLAEPAPVAPVVVEKAEPAPEPAPEPTCASGHLRDARDAEGECWRCALAVMNAAKTKKRLAAVAKAKARAKPKRPGPPRRERCLNGGHALTDENVYVSRATGRRRCRECTRERDRARRKRGRKNYQPAPTPILSQEVER